MILSSRISHFRFRLVWRVALVIFGFPSAYATTLMDDVNANKQTALFVVLQLATKPLDRLVRYIECFGQSVV